jgi:hypothetical protein
LSIGRKATLFFNLCLSENHESELVDIGKRLETKMCCVGFDRSFDAAVDDALSEDFDFQGNLNKFDKTAVFAEIEVCRARLSSITEATHAGEVLSGLVQGLKRVCGLYFAANQRNRHQRAAAYAQCCSEVQALRERHRAQPGRCRGNRRIHIPSGCKVCKRPVPVVLYWPHGRWLGH